MLWGAEPWVSPKGNRTVREFPDGSLEPWEDREEGSGALGHSLGRSQL